MSKTFPVPTLCPVCGEGLHLHELGCSSCETQLRGNFDLPALAKLPPDLQEVVIVFLRCRGNIKEVERELGISYPTVSKKLDTINYLLGAMTADDSAKSRVIRQLAAGDLTVADAIAALKQMDQAKRRTRQ